MSRFFHVFYICIVPKMKVFLIISWFLHFLGFLRCKFPHFRHNPFHGSRGFRISWIYIYIATTIGINEKKIITESKIHSPCKFFDSSGSGLHYQKRKKPSTSTLTIWLVVQLEWLGMACRETMWRVYCHFWYYLALLLVKRSHYVASDP